MKVSIFFTLTALILSFQVSSIQAEEVGFASTGQGTISRSDDLAIEGDPYAGKKVPKSAYKGHSSTQRTYQENCAKGDDMCIRAKKRQLSQ